ncbi:hypothetical protein MHI22_20555 [Lysinibacillus sp. FSL L8-0312]|uniref:hypothetical protein n=1 Tax=Lysinibacillus sp. FSL L8-0312 TaxID=2921521 RepID=UPI0030FC83E7
MLDKILHSLFNGKSKRRYSSSSSRRKYSKRHNYYGHKHYKFGSRKSSRSLFSSMSFFSS